MKQPPAAGKIIKFCIPLNFPGKLTGGSQAFATDGKSKMIRKSQRLDLPAGEKLFGPKLVSMILLAGKVSKFM